MFSNRYLLLHGRPEVRLIKSIGFARKPNLAMSKEDLSKLKKYLIMSLQNAENDSKKISIYLGKCKFLNHLQNFSIEITLLSYFVQP